MDRLGLLFVLSTYQAAVVQTTLIVAPIHPRYFFLRILLNLLKKPDFSVVAVPFIVDGTVEGTGEDRPVLSGIDGVGAKCTPFADARTGLRSGSSDALERKEPVFSPLSVEGRSSGPGPPTRDRSPLFDPMLLRGGNAKGRCGFDDVTVAFDSVRECAIAAEGAVLSDEGTSTPLDIVGEAVIAGEVTGWAGR